MFLKRRFARWLTKIRLFFLHPICFNGIQIIYFIGLIILLSFTYFSPSIGKISHLIHEINLPKIKNMPNKANPVKSELHLVNTFYLNTSQSEIDKMNPISRSTLDLFMDFFIKKNEFLWDDQFSFFFSLEIDFFKEDTSEDTSKEEDGANK